MNEMMIRTRNTAHNKLVQQVLFAIGYTWDEGYTEFKHPGAKAVTLYPDRMGLGFHSTLTGFYESDKEKVGMDWLLGLVHEVEIDNVCKYLTHQEYKEFLAQLELEEKVDFPGLKMEVTTKKQSKQVQKMLFALGWKWSSGGINIQDYPAPNYIYATTFGYLTHSKPTDCFSDDPGKVIEIPLLLPETGKVITIDGKDIKLSQESFDNLKHQLS